MATSKKTTKTPATRQPAKRATKAATAAKAKPRATKSAKTRGPAKRATKTAPPEKMSQIAAAERVLGETGEAMSCKTIVETMVAKGYWASPGGKTPEATLYASLIRHIAKNGKKATFQKTDRGMFALAGKR